MSAVSRRRRRVRRREGRRAAVLEYRRALLASVKASACVTTYRCLAALAAGLGIRIEATTEWGTATVVVRVLGWARDMPEGASLEHTRQAFETMARAVTSDCLALSVTLRTA